METRLHAIEAGSPALPPLVMLHGFGMNSAGFAGLFSALSARFSIIAFDLPGHGGSLHHPSAGSARKCAAAVQAELENRGLSGIHLVGHSFGGAVAVLLAIASPALFSRLTLLAPGGFSETINAPLLRRSAEATGEPELRACLDAMSATARAPDDLVGAIAAMRRQPGQTEALQALAGRFLNGDMQGVLPLAAYCQTGIPARLVWGSEDPVVPVTGGMLAPACFHKTIIAGAGHMLMQEAPQAVVQAIVEPLPTA